MGEKTKQGSKIDWKYIITELILIVLGILLAINLNTWNANRKQKHQTKLSIVKIQEEVNLNIAELSEVIEANAGLNEFCREIAGLRGKHINKIECSKEKMKDLKAAYAEQFAIGDSVEKAKGMIEYELKINYEIEYGELNDIAWQTAQVSNNVNEYEYDCLKNLLSVYGFQEIFVEVQNKFLDYKIMKDEEELIATIQLCHRMGLDLLERYKSLEEEIEKCR